MLILPKGMAGELNLPETVCGIASGVALDTQPLRVGVLNLMPHKQVTDSDLIYALQAADVPLRILPVKIGGQQYKTTPAAYVQRYYTDFETVAAVGLDRLIITGAPLEQIPFEEVRYWPQLCDIMDWAHSHVRRTLHICWGAQAALYHYYGIDKCALPAKCFGIFRQRNLCPGHPLMRLMGEMFNMPNSRHTTIRREDVLALDAGGLRLLADSSESGPGIVGTDDGRHAFVLGHFEYGPQTLDNEYRRDLSRGLSIAPPRHYYDKAGNVAYSWREAARTFYKSWVE